MLSLLRTLGRSRGSPVVPVALVLELVDRRFVPKQRHFGRSAVHTSYRAAIGAATIVDLALGLRCRSEQSACNATVVSTHLENSFLALIFTTKRTPSTLSAGAGAGQ